VPYKVYWIQSEQVIGAEAIGDMTEEEFFAMMHELQGCLNVVPSGTKAKIWVDSHQRKSLDANIFHLDKVMRAILPILSSEKLCVVVAYDPFPNQLMSFLLEVVKAVSKARVDRFESHAKALACLNDDQCAVH
jgi:hypothetical protein